MSLLEKTLRWIVLAGIFVLPCIVFIKADSLFFPYITGKNFAFRLIVEVITGAWLALAITLPEYRPRRSWLLAAFSLFVCIIAIADAHGAYPFKSFWSNYERMDGWVTLAHLYAYVVVAMSMMNTEVLWRRLLQVSLGESVLMGMYGLLQIAGKANLAPGFSSTSRIDATFGNPIYLAVYMLFHVGIAALLLARTWGSEQSTHVRWRDGLLYGFVITLDTLVLFLTGTRGTMLGFFVGVVCAIGAYAWSSRSRVAWKVMGIGIGIVLIGAGVLVAAKNTSVVRDVGFLNRLSTISLSDPTVHARLLNVTIALKGFEERPLLGWGQENYALVFDTYYDPRMYDQEQWFDRVHNVIFDWLIAGGLLGLCGYLSLFASALWILWRSPSFLLAEKSVLTGIGAAYFFHDLFVFDNIASYMLFATLLAYVAWRASESMNSARICMVSLVARDAFPIVVACSILGVWGVAWFVNADALAQNRMLIQAMSLQREGLTKNLAYFKQAIEYGSFGTQEAREQLANNVLRIASDQSTPVDIRNAFGQMAIQEMTAMQLASPLDARFPLFLGMVYEAYGQNSAAVDAFGEALQRSPKKQTILYEIASNKLKLNDPVGALASFKQAFELDEDNLDARLYYAMLAIRLGKQNVADQLLGPVIASGNAADPRIIAAYVAVGDFARAAEVQSAKVRKSPNDPQGYFMLASIYYEHKDMAHAIATLQAAKAAVPSITDQADTFIRQIKNGTLVH